MIDAVLSYHTNPATCGVAKFNQRLARELGVPCLPLNEFPIEDSDPYTGRTVLVSIKPSEIRGSDIWWYCKTYDLLLHDRALGDEHPVIKKARRVWYADEIGCPSTIEGNRSRGDVNVLTFGMAHKIQTKHYETLKLLLDATGRDYTVSVSTAVHEGSPWDETALVGDKLRAIFGDRLRILGYLADDALVAEMARCSAIAMFFDPALRANNTTFWAAVDSGAPVVTNLDEQSPDVAHRIAMDIAHLVEWPKPFRAWHNHRYTWSNITNLIMQEESCAK